MSLLEKPAGVRRRPPPCDINVPSTFMSRCGTLFGVVAGSGCSAGIEPAPFRVHSPALLPFELRSPSIKRTAGVEPAESGVADPHPAVGHHPRTKSFSTPGRDRTCRFPIWRRAFRRWNIRRIVMRREGFEPPMSQRDPRVTAWCIAVLPPARSSQIQSISVEGFEPSTPCARGTCAAKLRHTLKTLPVGIEPDIVRMKAGHPVR
jgi:hypothetical protein